MTGDTSRELLPVLPLTNILIEAVEKQTIRPEKDHDLQKMLVSLLVQSGRIARMTGLRSVVETCCELNDPQQVFIEIESLLKAIADIVLEVQSAGVEMGAHPVPGEVLP